MRIFGIQLVPNKHRHPDVTNVTRLLHLTSATRTVVVVPAAEGNCSQTAAAMLCACIRSYRRFSRRMIAFLVIAFSLVTISFLFSSSEGATIFSKRFERLSHSSNDTFQETSGSDLSANQSCVHPKLILWHPELKSYFTDPKALRCSEAEENWVYTVNGTFRISNQAIKKHGSIMCRYVPIYRGKDDFVVTRGNPISPVTDGDRLTSDVFEAKCVGSDGTARTNIYVGVAPEDGVRARRSETNKTEELLSLDLDILMFGFDSVSRMTWMRNLPNSYKYFVEVLGAVVLEGYNIVGDGTPQALLPILTGKTEQELPEARRGFSGAKTVDDHPWIWGTLKNYGYATQWGEDSSSFGTFTYRMLGFQNQPVDHYMRTFYVASENEFKKYYPNCLGSLPRHLNMLNWMKDFCDVYAGQRKFSYVFHAEYTHNGYSDLRIADNDLKNFLEYLYKKGHLDRAMLILMSDHGARFQNVRNTEQGKYEERMPFFSVRLPKWFQEKYPDAAKNLKTNAGRLVTPFDIHETFHDVIDFKGSGRGDVSQRGISLFKEIPKERTCADAGIEPHWCACLSWTVAKSSDEQVRQAALAVVQKINSLTEPERGNCVELRLAEITKAVKWSANDNLLRFRKSADAHGRVPDLSDKMDATESLYQVTLRTEPGDALYEGTVKFSVERKRYSVSDREISRINIYGNQPHCVRERLPHLRPYCYCKIQFPIA